MAETARHWVTRVIPDVRTRMWTLSLPFELRRRLAFHHDDVLAVHRVVTQAADDRVELHRESMRSHVATREVGHRHVAPHDEFRDDESSDTVHEMRWWSGFLLSAWWVVAPMTAAGQVPPTEGSDREAQSLFAAGRIAYEEGRFEVALSRFQEAYDLSGRHGMLYNIGQCLDRLRRDEEALRVFEEYLEQATDAGNRAEVEGRVRALRRATEAPEPPPDRQDAADAPVEMAAAPTPVAQPAAPAGPVTTVTSSAPENGAELYEEWWFWTLLGVAVVAGVAIPVGVVSASGSRREEPLRGDFGDGGVVTALEMRY